MSTAETIRNREAFRRFTEAVNSGDMELISNTIDQANFIQDTLLAILAAVRRVPAISSPSER